MTSENFLTIQCDGIDANASELIRPFHIDVQKNTALALIGKNDFGKTTLLKHMNGLTKKYKFTMQHSGVDWYRIPLRERSYKMGWLPQRLQYISEFSVLDLALLGRFIWHHGFPTKDDVKKCELYLEQLEMSSLRDRKL